MADLIDRQAAIESIQECADAAHSNHEWDMEQGYRNAIECIEEEPSAQPEIIHCRDCEHYDFGYACCRNNDTFPWSEDDYCSNAERRTDAAD